MFNVILTNTEKLSTQNKLFGAKNETIEKDVFKLPLNIPQICCNIWQLEYLVI